MSRPAIPLAAVVLAALLAGCTGSSLGPSNFAITPNQIGWNVGDEASFTLTLKPTMLVKEPVYTLDPDFAIAELALDRQGAGFGGYSTKKSSDVGLHIRQGNAPVEEAALDPGNATVEIRLELPENLNDAEYVLELRLFEVGWVKSAPFRVNVP